MKKYIYFVFNCLKSIQLAIILIIYIIIFSIIASLIPQNQSPEFYTNNYSLVIAKLILGLRFNNFFHSLLFMLPVAVFFINLLFCTINRLLMQFRKSKKKRFGPDIIHIGFLILLIGGGISQYTRQEGFKFFSEGDSAILAGDSRIILKQFDFFKYQDGSPRDWISTVEVQKVDKVIKRAQIEVNKPLKAGSYTIFQASYSELVLLYLKDKEDKLYQIKKGEGFKLKNCFYLFKGVKTVANEVSAIVEKWDEEKFLETLLLKKDHNLEQFKVDNISVSQQSGLKFVVDKGIVPIWLGIIIFFGGLFLTFLQKLWDNRQ